MPKNRRQVGWMFRTEGEPREIEVRLKAEHSGSFADDQAAWSSGAWQGDPPKEEDYKEREARFPDGNDGAKQAADWITEQIGRDDWRLEDMEFLGMRIYVPTEEG
jgi:hypothetical protein